MEEIPCIGTFNIIKKNIYYLDFLFTLELSLDSNNNLKIFCKSETGIYYTGEKQFKETRKEFLIQALNKEGNISLYGDPNKDDFKVILGGGFVEISLKTDISNENLKIIVQNLNKKCMELIKQVKISKEESLELKKELNKEINEKNQISRNFAKTYVEKIEKLIKNQEEFDKFVQKEKNEEILNTNIKLPEDWGVVDGIYSHVKINQGGNDIILNGLVNKVNLKNNIIYN